MFDQTICAVIGTCFRLAWTRLLTDGGLNGSYACGGTLNDAGQKSASGKLESSSQGLLISAG
jgi:hypothetical protein